MQTKRRSPSLALLAGLVLVPWMAFESQAQANLAIYTDRLVNGFQDWSWAARSLTNTQPVHSGSKSIRVTASTWEGLAFYHPEFDTSPYRSLSFWAHGGTSGGQTLQVQAHLGGVSQKAYGLSALPADRWQQFTIPLASLQAESKTNLDRITLQITGGGGRVFYLDTIELEAKPLPERVHLRVDRAQSLRQVDARHFGVNTAIWDSHFEKAETVSLLREMGVLTLRFPGGSLSDEYHWASNTTRSNTWQWVTSFTDFARAATNLGARVFITVNYGTGTPEEAAAWVRHANLTNRYGFKYWEVGNENYGPWETDAHGRPHDPSTYATLAAKYIQQMKAADPSIKVGVVAVPGEDSYSNGYTDHPAKNPRTGSSHNGWTPVMLSTLRSLGITPDFLVHHHYPAWTFQESDPLLLQSAVGWAKDARDLRRQIQDYFGPSGTNIELVVTENNSNSGDQGKQSTSLVNGLYLADSLGQLMRTEFKAFVWWDLRNGTDKKGNMDPSLYGWRTYGDLGMINGLSNRHPTFYLMKLMQYFARPGDMVLSAASDHLWLTPYAIQRTNGVMTLLVLNKAPSNSITAQIDLAGFNPHPTATLYSYGIAQDEAARTGLGSADLFQTNHPGVGPVFTSSFPPYSATLFTFAPEAPVLEIHKTEMPDSCQLELQGQPGARYLLQTSTNLAQWTSISTQALDAASMILTNTPPPGTTRLFWRARWEP